MELIISYGLPALGVLIIIGIASFSAEAFWKLIKLVIGK